MVFCLTVARALIAITLILDWNWFAISTDVEAIDFIKYTYVAGQTLKKTEKSARFIATIVKNPFELKSPVLLLRLILMPRIYIYGSSSKFDRGRSFTH